MAGLGWAGDEVNLSRKRSKAASHGGGLTWGNLR